MSVGNIVNGLYNGLSYESLDEWFNNLKHYEPPEIDLNDKSNIKYKTMAGGKR